MREAGSTAVQEIAFTFANAIAYIEAVRERGVDVDAFAPRLSWIFNTHINFFEEIAKYRALRRLWARIMKERFGANDPRSMMLRTHTQTGGSTLTAQQPENNIVRAGDPGAGRRARRRAVDGALLLRRGARDPDREGAEDRRPHAADHRRGDRRHRHDRPDGRLLLPRVADRRARAARRRGDGARSRRWAARSRRSSPATTTRRSSTRPTSGSRPSTTGERVVVGVNKYRDDDEPAARVLPGRPDAGRAPAREARAAARRARLGRGRAGARRRCARPPRATRT